MVTNIRHQHRCNRCHDKWWISDSYIEKMDNENQSAVPFLHIFRNRQRVPSIIVFHTLCINMSKVRVCSSLKAVKDEIVHMNASKISTFHNENYLTVPWYQFQKKESQVLFCMFLILPDVSFEFDGNFLDNLRMLRWRKPKSGVNKINLCLHLSSEFHDKSFGLRNQKLNLSFSDVRAGK